jgi:hypothetical protein
MPDFGWKRPFEDPIALPRGRPIVTLQDANTAADAADYLEKVVGAIRERRLYGFMLQEQAECAVGAGQWIKQTIEEVVAEATTETVGVRLPNVQRIKLRHDD